jgi:exopolysaccharide production protein ExoZ
VALIALSSQIDSPDTTGRHDELERFFIWGVPAACIVFSAVFWDPKPSPIARLAKLLGDASYSLYLTHWFVMVGYAVVLRRVPVIAAMSQWPVTSSVVGVAVILSILTHLTLERFLNRTVQSAFDSLSLLGVFQGNRARSASR